MHVPRTRPHALKQYGYPSTPAPRIQLIRFSVDCLCVLRPSEAGRVACVIYYVGSRHLRLSIEDPKPDSHTLPLPLMAPEPASFSKSPPELITYGHELHTQWKKRYSLVAVFDAHSSLLDSWVNLVCLTLAWSSSIATQAFHFRYYSTPCVLRLA